MATNNNHSTVEEFLSWSTGVLTKANILTARLDSLILLEDALDIDRAHLLAHPELNLSSSQLRTLETLVEQRKHHIPLAYLRGKVLFYGHSFYVNQGTLIPRPESEDIITLLIEHYSANKNETTVADIGTGSGCLGLTAALEVPNCRVDLYDIDSKALSTARRNARYLKIPASFFKEDLLLKARHRKYDVILANLPYVPSNYNVSLDVTFEPRLALFAGTDGLDLYHSFWRQLGDFITKPTCVITESFPETQHEQLILLADNAGYTLLETRGFIQLFTLTSQ